jgi:hypothetical protein
METLSKQTVEANLELEWKDFLRVVVELPAGERAAYLLAQGYPTLSSELAHIIAWWLEADHNIRMLMKDATFRLPAMDVEKFNAEVIRLNKDKPEQEVIQEFERVRIQLLELVASLSDAQAQHEEIQKELYWDIVNHYREHRPE